MFTHLVKKEVLAKIQDFRFMISSVIGLCLIVLTTVILSEQHSKQVAQYDEFVRNEREALEDVKIFVDLRQDIHREPNPLWIFNKGLTNQLDRRFTIEHESVPRQSLGSSAENPFLTIFTFFDLTTIFMIVLSLLAILMVYDSVSGEREEGTLIATLSNSVARYQVLLSKMIASFIGLAMAFLLSLIISLIIMMFFYSITFSADQWFRIILIIISTFLFLAVFVSSGMLISALVRHASIALVWLLFLWVFMIIIQTNIGSYLASALKSIPPREKMETAYNQGRNEMFQKLEPIEEQIQEEVPGDGWHSGHTQYGTYYHCWDGNRVGLYRYVLRTQRMHHLVMEAGENYWQIYKAEYDVHLTRQQRLQDIFNRFSPASVYNRITASLAQSDLHHFERFVEQTRNYRQQYMDYIINERKVFSDNANLWFTRQSIDQILNSNYEERSAANRRGEEVEFYGPDDYEALSLNGMPRFVLPADSILDSMRPIIIDFMILLFISILLFYSCSVAFNRYDVRADS